MAERRMTNKRLAELMGIHPNAVSRLKQQDTLPHIGSETIDSLCQALGCTLFDLVEYVAPSSSQLDKVNQNEPEFTEEPRDLIVRRLNVPLTAKDSDRLKRLAKTEERSEGKTAQRLIREGLDRAETEGKI
jgi:putative transcriptional regulator